MSGADWPRMLPLTAPDEADRLLSGRTIADVTRRGKLIVLATREGPVIAFHRKMSGNLCWVPAPEPPAAHTHLVLEVDGGWELRLVDPRKFSRVYVFPTREGASAYVDAALGPDAMDDLTPEGLAEIARGSGRRIKALLMDQSRVAGLGNLYTDEVLWEAGIHPLRAASTLTEAEVRLLYAAIQRVLRAAVERRGTSFDAWYRDLHGEPGTYQDALRVYGRGGTGALCPRCGEPLVRLRVDQRSSHLCPRCQPERAGAASQAAM